MECYLAIKRSELSSHWKGNRIFNVHGWADGVREEGCLLQESSDKNLQWQRCQVPGLVVRKRGSDKQDQESWRGMKLLQGVRVRYFPCCYAQHPDKSSLGGEGLFWLGVQGHTPKWRRSSGSQNLSQLTPFCSLLVTFLFSSGCLLWHGAATFRMGLPITANLICITPQRCPENGFHSDSTAHWGEIKINHNSAMIVR